MGSRRHDDRDDPGLADIPVPQVQAMPMQAARAPPRVDYRSLPISSSGRRPAKEAPMPLSEYEALHCLDAERFRRVFDVRDGRRGLREETYANRWNHMPIARPEYDSLKVYSTTNAYPDMPYIRCREEYYYQERLCNLLESIIQASQAGSRDASSSIFPPSGHQILGAFCFPFPLDKVYWMDNSHQGFSRWRRWAVDDSRVRTSHSYFFSYHNVEFWNISVERRREVYLRVPRTEFFNVTRDLPILNPPCVAYHTTILRRSSDPVVGAFWQVLFLEWALSVFISWLRAVRYGIETQGVNRDHRVGPTATSPAGRMFPLPRPLIEYLFKLGLQNLVRGTEYSEREARYWLQLSVSTDWSQTPGFLWYDSDRNLFYAITRSYQVQDDGRNYGARTEIPLPQWFREASHWEVPDYYPDEGRFTPRNFNSAAASYEVEVPDPYVQAPIPPSAERPLPVYTEEPTPAPASVSRQPTGAGMDYSYPATGVPPSSGPMRVPQVPSSSRAPLSVSGPAPTSQVPPSVSLPPASASIAPGVSIPPTSVQVPPSVPPPATPQGPPSRRPPRENTPLVPQGSAEESRPKRVPALPPVELTPSRPTGLSIGINPVAETEEEQKKMEALRTWCRRVGLVPPEGRADLLRVAYELGALCLTTRRELYRYRENVVRNFHSLEVGTGLFPRDHPESLSALRTAKRLLPIRGDPDWDSPYSFAPMYEVENRHARDDYRFQSIAYSTTNGYPYVPTYRVKEPTPAILHSLEPGLFEADELPEEMRAGGLTVPLPMRIKYDNEAWKPIAERYAKKRATPSGDPASTSKGPDAPSDDPQGLSAPSQSTAGPARKKAKTVSPTLFEQALERRKNAAAPPLISTLRGRPLSSQGAGSSRDTVQAPVLVEEKPLQEPKKVTSGDGSKKAGVSRPRLFLLELVIFWMMPSCR